MVKAVLFDMDGVLVDSEPEYRSIEEQLCAKIGIAPSEEEKKSNAGKGQLDVWSGYKTKYGFSEDPRELVKLEAAIIKEYYASNRLKVIGPTAEFLKSCSRFGLKIAVATSSLAENAKIVINQLEIGRYVDAVAAGDMVKNTKPAPDIFLLAARLLGVSAAECAVIEDSENGVAAAKAAGMKVIGYKTPNSDQDVSQADIVVDTFRGISPQALLALLGSLHEEKVPETQNVSGK